MQDVGSANLESITRYGCWLRYRGTKVFKYLALDGPKLKKKSTGTHEDQSTIVHGTRHKRWQHTRHEISKTDKAIVHEQAMAFAELKSC